MKKNFFNTSELSFTTKKAFLETHPLEDKNVNSLKKIKEYWNASDTVPGFKEKVLSDESLILNNGYIQLSKQVSNKHFKRVRTLVDPYLVRKMKLKSKKLAITINDTPILIPNGDSSHAFYDTRVVVIPKDVIISPHLLSAYIVVEGKIKAFDEDNKCFIELEGHYEIMFGYSFVIFNEIYSNEEFQKLIEVK